MNRYKPHILVVPEDDRTRQIANGFLLHPSLKACAIQVLHPSGGWRKVLDAIVEVHSAEMRRYVERRVVLLIDFDGDPSGRLTVFRQKIPSEVSDRVFILGVFSEPEDLRRCLDMNLEDIGEGLARECVDNTCVLWRHKHLAHNDGERIRLASNVNAFLFPRA